jgi:hypothetical protein
VAGYFLFDLVVVIVLLNGILWGAIPTLVALLVFTVILVVWPPVVRTRAQFRRRYSAACAWVARSWIRWFQGRVALIVCFVLLIGFTFAYHYPVFAQRGITAAPHEAAVSPCPGPAAPLTMWPVSALWALVARRCATIRTLVLDADRLAAAQEVYVNGALLLLTLGVYAFHHPYNQLTAAGRAMTSGRRWLWGVTAALQVISLTYLPGGYAVLFLDKQAPLVTFEFKDAGAGKAAANPATPPPRGTSWRDSVLDRNWYLVFQNEKEIWLYNAPHVVMLQKDQLAGVEIRNRHWIFD